MKIFLDTANIEEIRKASELGVVDGVTTNPSLIAKEGRRFEDVVKEGGITHITDHLALVYDRKLAYPPFLHRHDCFMDVLFRSEHDDLFLHDLFCLFLFCMGEG